MSETTLYDVKLPNKIISLINKIDKMIQEINNKEQTVLLEVKDVFDRDENGNLYLKHKFLEIDDTVGFGSFEDKNYIVYKEPYHLTIKTSIDSHVDSINDFKIRFDKDKLIDSLKHIKSNGGKIGVKKTNDGRNIYASPKNKGDFILSEFDVMLSVESYFMFIEVN